MTVKVELGFTSAGASAPFFTLGSPTLGVLGGTTNVLGGGEILIEVTEYLKSFNITRGKGRELDRYNAGQASVSFKNDERVFDPTFEASPYFGQIQPRRQIRITVDEVVSYEGTVDDWNIEYDRGGNSIAVCQAFDGFANLANINLGDFAPSEQLTGARITSALDNIEWPDDKRDIDNGNATVEAQTVSNDTSVLGYMQTVSRSEPGDLFISKTGDVKFVQRNVGFSSDSPILADDGTGIPYQSVNIVFGTELLFNEARVTNSTDVATAVNDESVSLFGKRDIEEATFLSDQPQLQKLADFLVERFSNPEFRFDLLEVDITKLTGDQRADMIALELGDVVQVKFTPSGIPPQVVRFGKVIKLDSSFEPTNERIRVGLQETAGSLLVLDDAVFGKLDSDNILGF